MKLFTAKIDATADGSSTLLHPILGDSYHSLSGAVEEGLHVYINAGLAYDESKIEMKIFEMGFGSGLNCLLTIDYAFKNTLSIDYYAIELYPLDGEISQQLNYENFVDIRAFELYKRLLSAPWGEKIVLTPQISVTKIFGDITKCEIPVDLDLVYYDAFAYDTQPQLWSSEIFSRVAKSMKMGGVLTTYSSKGAVKEALRSAGFEVKRLVGAAGKRHMVRAIKK